jgi:hypothetical protein
MERDWLQRRLRLETVDATGEDWKSWPFLICLDCLALCHSRICRWNVSSVSILARFSLIAVWCFLTAAWTNFTYGEIGDSGLRYRRLWGWREAQWYEIDNFQRESIFGGVSVTLRYAPKFARKLRFAGGFSTRFDEPASDQSSIVDRYNAICRDWRQRKVMRTDVP